MQVISKTLFSAEVMDADLTSEEIEIDNQIRVAIHNVWTDTPAGNIIIQLSNDKLNWNDFYTKAAGGGTGNDIKDFDTGFKYVRVIYTFTSSSGTLTSTICAKGV